MTTIGIAHDGARTGQLLTFGLDHEIFALEVDKVYEILDFAAVTAVPNAPGFAPGLVNVRGNVVPIIDLRCRFEMEPAAVGATSRVIVTESTMEDEPVLVGILADEVFEVVDVGRVRLGELPRLGTRWKSEFIRGVVKQERGFIVVLDVERILTGLDNGRRALEAEGH